MTDAADEDRPDDASAAAAGSREAAAPVSRRAMLATTLAAVGGAAASGTVLTALPLGAAGTHSPSSASQAQPAASAAPVVPPDATRVPGTPTTALGARSPFVTAERSPAGVITGTSSTPLHRLTGTITPSDLHFERHHGGVAHIDPRAYRLLVHGLAERATVFTLDDLLRLPSVTRVHFIECAGNGRTAYRSPRRDLTPQQIDGTTSNSEWTGVPVSVLLREVGMRADATWVLAEGGDAAVLSRSVPVAKMLDDAIVAYAQNGEPLRPAQGYPVRLLLPGWEGNMCVKWLRRLEAIAEPNMSRDETGKYTDPLPDGTARQFSFEMDVKSTITYPTHPARVAAPGWLQISGLAWSGRGRVTGVEVSTDGGRSWAESQLDGPALPKAHVRFRLPWQWDGRATTLMSRATDETGMVQPTLAEFRARRGPGTDYHYNFIRGWRVESDGHVFYAVDA